MIEYVAVVLVVGAVLFSRSIYRLLGPGRIDADGYFHLYLIEEIRNNGHRLPQSPEQVTTKGTYAYPYGMHWLLSYLPRRVVTTLERLFSPMSDVLLLFVILLLVPFGELSTAAALPGALLFLFTPQLVQPDQAHGTGISARKPGLILATIAIFLFARYTQTGDPYLFVGSVFLASFVYLTSKFSLQAMTAVLVAFAVFVSPLAMAVLLLGFVCAVVLSRGRYLVVFRTHLAHMKDYAVRKQYHRFDHSLGTPLNLIRDLRTATSWMDRLNVIFDSRRLFPLVRNPLPVAAVMAFLLAQYRGIDLGLSTVYVVWIGAGAVAFVLISLPHLLFLGEPERYLEYTYLPSFVVIAAGWNQLTVVYDGLVIGFATLGFVVMLGFVWAFERRLYEPERRAAIDDITEFLSEKAPSVVILQPSTVARNFIWKTDHTFVETLGNQASTEAAVAEYERLFAPGHGLVTDDIEWLAKEYDPKWVVFDRRWIHRTESPGSLSQPDVEPVYVNDQFEVYPFDAFTSERC